MKKIFCLLLSIVLLFSLATGCTSEGDVTYTKLTIWHHYQNDQLVAFSNMVENFNKTVGKEKGIDVSAEAISSIDDLAEKVYSAAQNRPGAGKMPEMFMAYSDSAFQVDALGKLAELDPYFTKSELDLFVDDYIEEGRLTGDKIKIFPVAKATEVFMINKTDWEKFKTTYNAANSDKVSDDDFSTYEGITSVAEKYYKTTGKAFYGRDAIANYMIGGAKQLGVDLLNATNGVADYDFNDEVMRKLWDNYYVPNVEGCFNISPSFASGDIKTNTILAYIGSSTSSGYFPKTVFLSQEEKYDIDAMVLPAPTFKGGTKTYIQQGAGFCVSKTDAKTEEACATFLKWFTEPERNIRFALSSNYLPVIKKAQDINLIKKVIQDENLKVSEITLKTIEVSIGMVNSGTMYTNKAFKGGVEARKLLEDFKSFTSAAAIKAKNSPAEKEALLSDQAFNSWYAALRTSLNNAAK